MNGWLHHAPAAFTIPFGFSLLIAVDWLMNRGSRKASRGFAEEPLPGPSPKRGGEQEVFSPPRFGEGPGEGFHRLPVTARFGLPRLVPGRPRFAEMAPGASGRTGFFPVSRGSIGQVEIDLGLSWHGRNLSELAELRSQLPLRGRRCAVERILVAGIWPVRATLRGPFAYRRGSQTSPGDLHSRCNGRRRKSSGSLAGRSLSTPKAKGRFSGLFSALAPLGEQPCIIGTIRF